MAQFLRWKCFNVSRTVQYKQQNSNNHNNNRIANQFIEKCLYFSWMISSLYVFVRIEHRWCLYLDTVPSPRAYQTEVASLNRAIRFRISYFCYYNRLIFARFFYFSMKRGTSSVKHRIRLIEIRFTHKIAWIIFNRL